MASERRIMLSNCRTVMRHADLAKPINIENGTKELVQKYSVLKPSGPCMWSLS